MVQEKGGTEMKRVNYFAVDQIERFKRHLTDEHFNILMAAESTDDMKTTAAALSIPIGTVKSRLHRARSALRKLMVEKEPAT